MFDKEFYPTPYEVIYNITFDVEIENKTILEPSAGKGNIIDVLKEKGAKKICSFEKNQELAELTKRKSTFLGYDFLEEATPETLSHIDLIIANPPFSNADEHIMKMWEVAPEGCKIISLCNSQLLDNSYSRRRRRLNLLLDEHGEIDNLGNCFSTAERGTDVEVSVVKMFKPVINDFDKFDGFFMDEDEEPEGNGIMPYNEIRDIVQSYVYSVKKFDRVADEIQQLNKTARSIGASGEFSYSIEYGDGAKTKEEFANQLQKRAWKYVFNKMDITKYVTSGVMKKINSFVENQKKYPFTMKNIYRMIDIIIQTREQTMNESIIEVFDKITRHYHDNRYQVEGWKTNKSYLVGKKFILEHCVEINFGGGMSFRYNGNGKKIDDFQKALKFLTGSNDDIQESYMVQGIDFSEWFDWGFFKCKGFKKGTLHVKFKDEKVWELFNRRVAKIKGFKLPETL